MTQMNLFALGTDGEVRRAVWDNSNWRWSAIGGAAFNQGNPISAVPRNDGAGNGTVNLFVLGEDGKVRWAFQDSSGWHWAKIDGAVFNQRNPITATSRWDDADNLFVLGEDGVVRWAFRDGSGWHWAKIDGAVFNQSTPISLGFKPDSSTSDPRWMNLFVLGEDDKVRWAFQDSSGWHWAKIDGAVFNQRNPITIGSNSSLSGPDLLVLGEDGVVRWAFRDGSGWHWAAISGAKFNQGNPISFPTLGRFFALGEDGEVRQAVWDNSTWRWSVISGAKFNQGNPVSAVARNDGTVNLFVLGEDGKVRWAFQDSSGWHWAKIDGAVFNQRNPITGVEAGWDGDAAGDD